MKKKVLALFLTLAMAVSLVTPAIATEPEEEPTLAQTVQTLFTTLLDLYKEENAGDAGLILAALAREGLEHRDVEELRALLDQLEEGRGHD